MGQNDDGNTMLLYKFVIAYNFNFINSFLIYLFTFRTLLFQLDKNCGKFRGKTLEHMDLMEQIFGGMTATGLTQWTPGEDLPYGTH